MDKIQVGQYWTSIEINDIGTDKVVQVAYLLPQQNTRYFKWLRGYFCLSITLFSGHQIGEHHKYHIGCESSSSIEDCYNRLLKHSYKLNDIEFLIMFGSPRSVLFEIIEQRHKREATQLQKQLDRENEWDKDLRQLMGE